MRLNAFLARAGVTSRRKADELIKNGQVLINGRPAKLNDEVEDSDDVQLNGKKIFPQSLRYILLNKPAGTVTTLSDPQNRAKVTDLIKIPERVVPVGRLDYDTSGALLLTNDGELANRLMHPSFEVDKVYTAEVQGEITKSILNMLSIGVELEDGKTAPAKASRLTSNTVQLTIHEGRNHQVKRMLAEVGVPAKRLHRKQYGPLDLAGLHSGQWRDLTDSEIYELKSTS